MNPVRLAAVSLLRVPPTPSPDDASMTSRVTAINKPSPLPALGHAPGEHMPSPPAPSTGYHYAYEAALHRVADDGRDAGVRISKRLVPP
jgi:hypothetical protein